MYIYGTVFIENIANEMLKFVLTRVDLLFGTNGPSLSDCERLFLLSLSLERGNSNREREREQKISIHITNCFIEKQCVCKRKVNIKNICYLVTRYTCIKRYPYD